MRPQFERAGARLAVLSSTDNGAADFISAVWPEGEVYIDSDETFKKALGTQKPSLWRALLPSAIRRALTFVKTTGQNTADISDKKTQLLGGTFVVKNGEVVFTHYETPNFENGDARELLAAVLGKSVEVCPTASGA
mmetsp:Transcript_16765/g.36311  ORF Transcript_16765/g.36311 Transcript_16765/m.36311 type:complete len:136 (-) Transcript_16765:344-751(-)